MRKLTIQTKESTYPIIISDKFYPPSECLQKRKVQCVIITDSHVEPLYLDALTASVKEIFSNIISYVFPAGEGSKSMNEVKNIYLHLIRNNVKREDVIIALGGGVTGDLAGYVAATYFQGIKLIQVPTTLLSQVDSSVGGKTAVNYMQVKNVIGAFYHPMQVQINYSVLRTLPMREIRNGLVEILVHAIIKDEDLFSFIERNLEKIERLNQEILEELIYRNCKIKGMVVERDERDLGERAILNFGHTYGHAIESAYKYRYRHGECVAIGIVGACYIAEKRKLLDHTVTKRIKDLLKRMQVLHTIHDCNKSEILEFIMHDKKIRGETICFILPSAIGHVKKYEIDDKAMIADVLDILSEEEWDW